MREYEFMFIVSEEGSSKKVHEPVVESVRTLLEGLGGRVLRIRPWGLRQFAYPIQKMRYGYYVIMQILIAKEQLPEFERKLKLDEKIIRYILTYLDERVDDTAPVIMSPSAEDDLLESSKKSEPAADVDEVDFEETPVSTDEPVEESDNKESVGTSGESVEIDAGDNDEPVEKDEDEVESEDIESDLEEPDLDEVLIEQSEEDIDVDMEGDVDFGDDLQEEIDKLEKD